MRHFYVSAFFTGLLSLFSAPSLFGDVLLDDFEYGNTCNKIGTYLYFWSDSNSTITGGYGRGNASDSAGKMNFTVETGAQYSMAYMGLSFDNALPPPPVDLSGAAAVRFAIKANRSMHIIFTASQSRITDSITAIYYRDISVTTSWTTVTVNLNTGTGGLTKLWGDNSFAINKLTGISWAYSPYFNSVNPYLAGTVWIDNVTVIGNPSELHDPFAPYIGWVSMPNVEWYPSVGATSYRLQISTSYTFTSYVVNQSNITDTTYKVPALTPGTTYYWRVNASGSGYTSRWSWVGNFTAPHLVSYEGNGSDAGTVPAAGANYPEGATVTVSANTGDLSKTGYVFSGWNTEADGKGTNLAAGATFTMGTSDVTLYAQWTSTPTYSVMYNGNGNASGSVPADPNNYLQGTTVAVQDNTGNLSRTGYAFSGWNTEADGSGTSYAADETFTMGTSDVALYAQWTLIPTYTVTYNGNGNTSGSAPADANNYQQGATVTALGNTGSLVKPGATFAGWNTAADGSGTTYTAGDTFAMGSANIVLYAQWPLNTYTLSVNRLPYRMFGQWIAEKIKDTVVTHGDTVYVTAVSVTGCSFIDWRVTAGKALLLDSTQSTCRIILSNGNAEITAHDICPLSVNNGIQKIPTSFELSCNGKTGTITFAIPKVTGFSNIPVSIRLFDVQGHLLSMVIDRTMSPGYYTTNIGMRGKITAGLVICRMESLGYRSVAKIIANRQ